MGIDLAIDRPDWQEYMDPQTGEIIINLSRWFDKNVAPVNKMLAEGVEVYSIYGRNWTPKPYDGQTSKALLINIQPIKEPTREEKLEVVVKKYVAHIQTFIDEKHELGSNHFDLFTEAKALLEEK